MLVFWVWFGRTDSWCIEVRIRVVVSKGEEVFNGC
jgi:hypothetical protein